MIVRTWNLGGNYSYEEPAESYRPCLSQSGRIKNDHWHHDWTVTGGYDPGKWEEGDYLIHVSGRLDRFIEFLPEKTPRLIAVPWKEPA